MARTLKRKVTTRKCQSRYLATKRVLAGGSLWSALGKVGRIFKSVEGKFKYNTV
jgi:hypothetical protein